MQIQLQLSLPKESRFVSLLRATTARLLTDLDVPDADVEDIELMLTEACANVVRHAADSTDYTVDVAVSQTGCVIEVRDHGPGFGDATITPPPLTAESGRGLMLMNALADKVTFDQRNGGNAVRLEKSWHDLIDSEVEAGS